MMMMALGMGMGMLVDVGKEMEDRNGDVGNVGGVGSGDGNVGE